MPGLLQTQESQERLIAANGQPCCFLKRFIIDEQRNKTLQWGPPRCKS